MKVLVTGGCGLIGYNTAKYYHEQGAEVVVMDNLERSKLLGHAVNERRKYYNARQLQEMGVKWTMADVSREEAWTKVNASFGRFDTVIHLAGQCGVPTSIADPRRDFEVNAMGTFNALEAARKWDASLVYASTNKVYPIHEGWHQDKDGCEPVWRWTNDLWHKHGFPVRPMDGNSRTPYGASKFSGDLYCQEYSYTYGVKTGVFRMSCIYGPNQFGFEEQGWATWFAIATLKGLPINIYGDGYQVRDMLYVEDLVKAYDAFVKSDIQHSVFNMGGGPGNVLSLNECLDVLEEYTGKRSQINYQDWRPSDQRVYTSDIRPAQDRLFWAPEVSPSEGLKRVVEWVIPLLDVF